MPNENWLGLVSIANIWRQEPGFLEFLHNVSDGFKEGASDNLNRGLYILGTSNSIFDSYPLLVEHWGRSIEAYPLGNLPVSEIRDYVRPFISLQGRALGLTAWLRSRMPGYPLFRPLRLAKGTSLTSEDASLRLNWLPEVYQLGLQYESVPPWHGLNKEKERIYREASGLVFKALRSTSPWLEYSESFNALDATDQASLKEGRRRIASRLSTAQVDSAEPERMLNRAKFRDEVVDDELENVTLNARKFSVAFDNLDFFITDLSQTVLGWMVQGHKPQRVSEFDTLTVGPAGEVSFSTREVLSKMAFIESPITPDVFRVTHSEWRSNQLGIIPGEAGGFPISGFPESYELWEP